MRQELSGDDRGEPLAQANVGVPVSRLAKWKTALQLIALGILLLVAKEDRKARIELGQQQPPIVICTTSVTARQVLAQAAPVSGLSSQSGPLMVW